MKKHYIAVCLLVIVLIGTGITQSNCPLRISAGKRYSASLMQDRTAWTWGRNNEGQLGDGTSGFDLIRTAPVQVFDYDSINYLGDIARISAGEEHTVALKTETVHGAEWRTVWVWGRNDYGQLGNGTTEDSNFPVLVLDPSGLTFLNGSLFVSAGGDHTIALYSEGYGGYVLAWGRNNHGQLGVGSTENSSLPVFVQGPYGVGFLEPIMAISAGRDHNLALGFDGMVWAWGYNYYGRLGDGSILSRYLPVQVLGEDGIGYLTEVSAISAGPYHNLALKSDRTVRAWGYNAAGQLGNGVSGSGAESHTPVQVLGADGIGFLDDVVAISAGGNHSLALKSDGTVWAWGWNSRGQLGNGTTMGSNTAVQVCGMGGAGYLSNIVEISAGYEHSIALRSDGVVWAWGCNTNGEFGNGTITRSTTPVPSLMACNYHLDISENSAVNLPLSIAFDIYPNPFNSELSIRYSLNTASDVQISVYDIFGRLIDTILKERQPIGYHEAKWDAPAEASSGVYLIHLTSQEGTKTKKAVLIR